MKRDVLRGLSLSLAGRTAPPAAAPPAAVEAVGTVEPRAGCCRRSCREGSNAPPLSGCHEKKVPVQCSTVRPSQGMLWNVNKETTL